MKKLTFVVLSLLIFCVSDVYADSDGYYCAGPGYVAYQFRAMSWFTMGRHIVRVVKLSDGKAIWAGDAVLKDFQPHLMRCGADHVTVGGYDRGWVEYDIDISRSPSVRAERSDPNRKFKPGEHAPLQNLGNWSRATTVTLPPAKNDGFVYLIEITVTQDPTNRRCTERVSTLVATRPETPKGAQYLVLYKGRSCESAD